jgi:phosphoenolpyruvate synthase/pyruvate phosphate dikinase
MLLDINSILDKKWHFYVSRRFNWFVENTQSLINTSDALLKYVNIDTSQKNYLILNGDEYFNDQEALNFNLVFQNAFNQDELFFSKLKDIELQIADEINCEISKLQQLSLDNITNKQLADLIKNFQESYEKSFAPAFSRPDDFLEQATKLLLKQILNLSVKETNNYFSTIATYPDIGKIAYTEEPLELMRLTNDIKSRDENPDRLSNVSTEILNQHISEYSWLKGPVLIEDIKFEKIEYLDRIKNLLSKDLEEEITHVLNVRKKDQAKYTEFIKKYQISGRLLLLANAVRDFIFLRTYTTEISDHFFYTARHTILKKASERLKLNLDEIVMLSSGEIIKALNNKLTNFKQLIKERQKGYAIIWVKGNIYNIFGEEAINLQTIFSKKFKETTSRNKEDIVIKGNTASLGKVTGKVKILDNYNDVNKVNAGDIIVATMTTPDYVIAMEKAIAFITDEGGITCHAAIVAREFGIPCIVGTINATKLLRDGDIVEVNANEGYVKLLK